MTMNYYESDKVKNYKQFERKLIHKEVSSGEVRTEGAETVTIKLKSQPRHQVCKKLQHKITRIKSKMISALR